MNKFLFWQRWLFVVTLVIVGFGLLLAFFSQTLPFDLLFNRQINPVFWGSPTVSSDVRPFQGWAYGLLGATIAGWGLCLAFVAYTPFKKRERWAWNCILWGLLLWFVVDTGISLFFHVYFNALFNLILCIAAMLPIWFTRNDFL